MKTLKTNCAVLCLYVSRRLKKYHKHKGKGGGAYIYYLFPYLVESSQVPVVFCCLDITLAEVQTGEVEGEEVELLGLDEQGLVLIVAVVDGDLLEDEGQHSLAGGKEQMVGGQMLPHDGERLLCMSLSLIEIACKVKVMISMKIYSRLSPT